MQLNYPQLLHLYPKFSRQFVFCQALTLCTISSFKSPLTSVNGESWSKLYIEVFKLNLEVTTLVEKFQELNEYYLVKFVSMNQSSLSIHSSVVLIINDSLLEKPIIVMSLSLLTIFVI